MLLRIEGLDVVYRGEDGAEKTAARDVNLELDRGEVLALVGESGSGKSSVAMAIPRLLPSPPAAFPRGRILFDGEDLLATPLARLRELRGRRIGVVFQDPMGSLSPLMRIGDQLVETVLLHEKITRRVARELALKWLLKVGIPEPEVRMRAYPHELSGGMQQRVMIAMAMILGPDLVIADEPTTALDVTIQASILKLMKSLLTENSAILLISHDLGVVSEMATKIAVMRTGEIVESRDELKDFFANPHHPYSTSLIAEARRMSIGFAASRTKLGFQN